MSSQASLGKYQFNQPPSIGDDLLRWDVPEGYPWIDVEIGGGMVSVTISKNIENAAKLY